LLIEKLRRAVEHYLEDPLAEALLRGEVKDGELCIVVRNGEKLEFRQKDAASPAADSGVKT
jgi:ATP-dependent Clp protease ATP-binding subunit ClpC